MSNYAVAVEVAQAVVAVEVAVDCPLSAAELGTLSYSLAPGTY